MKSLSFEELSPELKQVLDPAKPKALAAIAKGLAPLPPALMISAWSFLVNQENEDLSTAARQSLEQFPEKMLVPALQNDLPPWALAAVGRLRQASEAVLEAILLNDQTPNSFVIDVAKTVSERLATLIANNQERIIECPEIVLALELNPQNLKSNTDRLRHFLKLAGISIPGERADYADDSETPPVVETSQATESETERTDEEILAEGSRLSEQQRENLTQLIMTLNVGGKVKLALKGNKEARGILIRDSNKVVAMAVLKSPRITENEICKYALLKSLPDDVVRAMASNPAWTKNYNLKAALCMHPKTPLQASMGFMKFLNLRDLTKLSKEKNIPPPIRKAAKELLQLKRK